MTISRERLSSPLRRVFIVNCHKIKLQTVFNLLHKQMYNTIIKNPLFGMIQSKQIDIEVTVLFQTRTFENATFKVNKYNFSPMLSLKYNCIKAIQNQH